MHKLPTALAREVMQSPPSVRLSLLLFYCIIGTDSVDLEFLHVSMTIARRGLKVKVIGQGKVVWVRLMRPARPRLMAAFCSYHIAEGYCTCMPFTELRTLIFGPSAISAICQTYRRVGVAPKSPPQPISVRSSLMASFPVSYTHLTLPTNREV